MVSGGLLSGTIDWLLKCSMKFFYAIQADQKMLRRAFNMFSDSKTDMIENEKVEDILKTLGYPFVKAELQRAIHKEDVKNTGRISFDSFCNIMIPYLPINDEEDDEIMQQELKEAFKLYDKAGNGYIPVSSLREILSALDDQLTPDQINEMITEIDTDGSGTVDFDGKWSTFRFI